MRVTGVANRGRPCLSAYYRIHLHFRVTLATPVKNLWELAAVLREVGLFETTPIVIAVLFRVVCGAFLSSARVWWDWFQGHDYTECKKPNIYSIRG